MDKENCMVNGRFQPFTIHHMHYIKRALIEHSDKRLIIAVTNPTVETTRLSTGDDHRHLREANPYTFEQRKEMIQASLMLDNDITPHISRICIIPFPINTIIESVNGIGVASVQQTRQIISAQTDEMMRRFNYRENVKERIIDILQNQRILQYMIIGDGWGEEKRNMFEKAGYDIEVIEYPRITSGTAVRYLKNNNDSNWKRLVPEGAVKVIQRLESKRLETNIGQGR